MQRLVSLLHDRGLPHVAIDPVMAPYVFGCNWFQRLGGDVSSCSRMFPCRVRQLAATAVAMEQL